MNKFVSFVDDLSRIIYINPALVTAVKPIDDQSTSIQTADGCRHVVRRTLLDTVNRLECPQE